MRKFTAIAMAILATATTVVAGPIFVGPLTTTSLGQSLSFDLGAAGLGPMPSDPSEIFVQGVSGIWSINPPLNSAGLTTLAGSLEIAGLNTGLSFQKTLNPAMPFSNIIFSPNMGGSTGLLFTEQFANQLIAGGGISSAQIIPTAATQTAWETFFAAGGTISQFLFFEVSIRPRAQVIPEPTALLGWGAIVVIVMGSHWLACRRGERSMAKFH